MFTIIGSDGKEYGPVTADQIRAWIAAGRANLDSQAKLVGATEWKRLGDWPEFGAAASAPPPVVGTPISTPLRMTGPVDAKAYAEDLLARGAKLDLGECLSESF